MANTLKLMFILLLAMGTGQDLRAQSEDAAHNYAVAIMDKMSTIIGDMTSCSYELQIVADKCVAEGQSVTQHRHALVNLVGPDKLQVFSEGNRGKVALWYNGATVSYYNFDQNNYSVMEAPNNIIDVIDELNTRYNIDFPGADVLYPAFTDDVLQSFSKVELIGRTKINGVECFHISAVNEELQLQLWVENSAYFLPLKYSLTYLKSCETRYECSFHQWKVNPDLPNSIFEFIPPVNAKEILMLGKP